ncbi:hypothetical protein GN316_19535 [Xylophilus sp. Kf1]|nr:hypothetical protein [Xylophilus sp. Kf1]
MPVSIVSDLDRLPVGVDAGCCPLCGDGNACGQVDGEPAMDGTDLACWCRDVRVSPAILDRIPPAARGRACVCRRCIGII